MATPLASANSPGLAIHFHEIEKRYGLRLALRNISLEIGAGECVALAGHNGSGKTTLLKIAALLARPSRGSVAILRGGAELEPAGAKRSIGMVAHATLVYDELTAEENLIFFAKLYGLGDPAARARRALEPAGLASRAHELVRTFSRGMRQRLSVARALLASPELLLLDEPMTGLDVEGQQWLAATLARLRAEGCTILMSAHGNSLAHASVTRAIRLHNGEVTHDSGPSGDATRVLALAASEDEPDAPEEGRSLRTEAPRS